MIWNDEMIAKWAGNGGIYPYYSELVNPSSYDLLLGTHYRLPLTTTWSSEFEIPKEGMAIRQGNFVLLHTYEVVKMPENAAAYISLKSTTARRGIEHLNAGYVDPGFEGQLTLEIINHWPFPQVIYKKQPIVQLVLFEANKPRKLYNETGHYQAQMGATPPWYWEAK